MRFNGLLLRPPEGRTHRLLTPPYDEPGRFPHLMIRVAAAAEAGSP